VTKQEILEAIERREGAESEGERDAAVLNLKRIAPHARLSDLIYYPERDRTREEIADEALLREQI
jgi:2-oxo-4-hydroxy-4-carboxy--5-ureidoimidazoline (OHCU) decarboxylase